VTESFCINEGFLLAFNCKLEQVGKKMVYTKRACIFTYRQQPQM